MTCDIHPSEMGCLLQSFQELGTRTRDASWDRRTLRLVVASGHARRRRMGSWHAHTRSRSAASATLGSGDRSNEAKLEAGPVALHTGPGWLMIGEGRTVVMP